VLSYGQFLVKPKALGAGVQCPWFPEAQVPRCTETRGAWLTGEPGNPN